MTRLKVARKIFNAFPTPEARERLLKMRRADDTALPVGVVDRLCSPSLAADREELMERACREGWSEYDSKNHLKANQRGKSLRRTGGRKAKPLKSLSLTLARWQREADSLTRSIEATSRPEVVASLLASSDADTVTTTDILDARRSIERVMIAVVSRLKMLDEIANGLAKPKPQTDQTSPPTVSKPEAGPGPAKPGRTTRRSKGSHG